MVLNSYSKINLSLRINSKSRDGLHEIQSLFCLINLSDKIKIYKINKKKDQILFMGAFAKHIKKSDNSIDKLLKLLRRLKLISGYYSVTIQKNIPVFGGLGGGTSNAAFILKFLLKERITKNILNITEKLIGSDLRLFFCKHGFLEKLKTVREVKKKNKLVFLLIYPNINCSTREIYLNVKKYSKKKIFSLYKINTKKKFISYILDNKNELQPIAEKKYPIIKKLLTDISTKKGCYLSRMTGSGSVCYGIFTNERVAKNALSKIRNRYPKFWFSIAKTV